MRKTDKPKADGFWCVLCVFWVCSVCSGVFWVCSGVFCVFWCVQCVLCVFCVCSGVSGPTWTLRQASGPSPGAVE